MRNEKGSGAVNSDFHPEPIAIIGIGCRFPGARGPAALWELIRNGVDAVGDIPGDRFDIDPVYDPRPGIPGKIITRRGGFLEDIDRFDPYFFGISPREAAAMDPQQRLVLEVAWEAMEDAGQVPEHLEGSATGVFLGACSTDYAQFLTDPTEIDIYASGGIAFSVLSGRVSYVLGLQGPSISVDTACSTSLVAVHLACQSLRAGESTLAMAGGVNLILLPEPYMGFSRAGGLAPDGRCKFGDARGNGFVRSEGAGIVVLKPLPRAVADRDPIYGVIRGSAVNNDGRSGGLLMAPSTKGQAAAFRAAYRSTGLSPGRVQYVEAHGTGTSVGDPIELESLASVLIEGRPEDQPCRVGSVKTNIGHTEGAAGVAGLIKTALSLKHREIPPSLHFETPNPALDWSSLPIVVPTALEPWPEARPALAAVSSFGLSGTNAHVIVEEFIPAAPEPLEQRFGLAGPNLLTLSAHTPDALRDMANAYIEFLRNGNSDLRDICYTANARRSHHDHRLAIVPDGKEQAVEHLGAFVAGESRPGMSTGRRVMGEEPRVVFVFPGQGSQWLGMGKDLLAHEPVFRDSIERCDAAIRRYADWSLLEELDADEASSRLDELDVIQPAIFAVQVALADLWRSQGVEPDIVVGHSMGEVAAAYVAGILSIDDAARVICLRSQLVRERASGHGGMAVIELAGDVLRETLAPFDGRICIASYNSPNTTVVAGEPEALKTLNTEMDKKDVFFQMVKVDYASHSPHMDPLRESLLAALEGLEPREGNVPMLSTVNVSPLNGTEADPTYWVRNIREPVCFLQAIETLVRDGHEFFVEMSPHPSLSLSLSQIVSAQGKKGTVVPSMRRDDDAPTVLFGSLGMLHVNGFPLDWTRIHPEKGKCVALPAFPWQRERFWLHDSGTGKPSFGRHASRDHNAQGHPLLGRHTAIASPSGTHLWEMELSAKWSPYLKDHCVQQTPVLPGAAYMEMALSAAREALGEGQYALENVTFHKALFLPDDEPKRVQLILSSQFPGEASFEFHELASMDGQEAEHLAYGTVRTNTQDAASIGSPQEVLTRCSEPMTADELYETADQAGIQYGPSFRGVVHLEYNEEESIGELFCTEEVAVEGRHYAIHPALLDACFQVGAGFLARKNRGKLFLPVNVGRFRVFEPPSAKLWSYARLVSDDGDGIIEISLQLIDEHGQTVAEVEGFRCKEVGKGAGQGDRNVEEDLYTIDWEFQEDPTVSIPERDGTWILLAEDSELSVEVSRLFEAQGQACVQVRPADAFGRVEPCIYNVNPSQKDDFARLFRDILDSGAPALRGVVHLWTSETVTRNKMSTAAVGDEQRRGCLSVLHLVQAMAEANFNQPPGLWLVTRGTQGVDGSTPLNVVHAPLWGLGKVIALEHPELRCKRIDLDRDRGEESERLFRELCFAETEDQVALRGAKRFVPRLIRYQPEHKEEELVTLRGDQPFSLEVPTPGILDDFRLGAASRRTPGPGEVEFRVRAAGINFRDVMISLGLLPLTFGSGSVGANIGYEFSGKIVRVGEGVERFKVGDEILGMGANTFASYAFAKETWVAHKPRHMSFEEAATVPAVFLTTYYALRYVGRLKKGERILIHAASGGVGLAAVQLAQWVGAEIFATAGSPEKRDFVRALGIEHVMDSRSLDFAREIMEITNGEGIDVVLNSLAGEFIPKGLAVLRLGGRFLELGKVDVLRNSPLGLRQLERNISFTVIDLSAYYLRQPEVLEALYQEFMPYFEDKTFKPLHHQTFPIAEAAEAFRQMAQAKHKGKLVLSLPEDDAEVRVAPQSRDQIELSGQATYLITGGLGGIGLELAKWMVQRGARHLALMGRRGVTNPETEAALQSMRDLDVRIQICQADVADEKQMTRVFAQIKESMPPLKGVVHGAAVLDDGILLQLNDDRFRSVLAPKIDGAWNLHRLTLDTELDFFVLFSSVAAVLGSPGQGNYVAGSNFLDALAHHRRALGLPGQVINWGAWAEVGLAVRQDRAEHLTRQGIIPFDPTYGMELMDRMLLEGAPQMAGVAVDWAKLLTVYDSPLVARLRDEVHAASDGTATRSSKGRMRAEFVALPPEERPDFLANLMRDQMASVLKCPPEKVDLHQPLTKLGIDSLMAVELKNRVENDLDVTLPVTALLQGPSLSQLAGKLLDQLANESPADQTRTAKEGTPEERSSLKYVFESEGRATAGDAGEVTPERLVQDSRLDPTIRPATHAEEAAAHWRQDPKVIFLTGATGFLGAFLLRELLDRTDADVYCLVRSADRDGGARRLSETLKSYGLWEEHLSDRIIPVLGDLSRPHFALDPPKFDDLARKIDLILHNGALVNYIDTYPLMRGVNVLGTQEVLRLASQFEPKPVHFVSTIGVVMKAADMGGEVVAESRVIDADQLIDSAYVRTKWVAEALVRSAGERGIPFAIYRPTRIAGDSRTGAFNAQDLLNQAIRGIAQLGKMPVVEEVEDNIVPVDYVSRSIVHLALQQDSLGRTFHIASAESILWSDLLKPLESFGHTIQRVSPDDFRDALNTQQDNSLYAALSALEGIPLIQEYSGFLKWPRIDCQNTLDGLKNSDIRSMPIDRKLLETYFARFVDSGFLTPRS